MTDRLTLEDAKGWKLRQSMHGHGKGTFFYEYACVQHPRLRRFDRYDRKTRSVNSTWRVDDQDCSDLADAVERLNTPPVFTPEEIDLLRKIAARTVEGAISVRDVPITQSYALQRKGAFDIAERQLQLSEIGKAAIA